jgi:S-adenosylmethionine-diacylglycerol 3-amino-3-carboxypropyl transferase
MLINKLQFAITREDPRVECFILKQIPAQEVLVVCSGGDTVLALLQDFPDLKLTAFDFNPVQLEHLQKKASAPIDELNSEVPQGLCQQGNFESLFRQWRKFLNEFIATEAEVLSLFQTDRPGLISEILNHPYWPVAFDLHFHDSLLRAMFTESAIQHAPPGSYPRYFQRAFERGLLSPQLASNPFMQHLLIGKYLDLPPYLKQQHDTSKVELVLGTIFDVKDLQRFDLIQLSNIFDWSSPAEIEQSCRLLEQHMKPGASLLIRQINSSAPVEQILGAGFTVNHQLSDKLLAMDQSLFYSKIIFATRGA